jgi:hypothetical protein
VVIDWGKLPSQLSDFDEAQKDQLILRVLSYMLYPQVPGSADTGASHDEKRRQQLLIFDVVTKLAEHENRSHKSDSTRAENSTQKSLMKTFHDLGGFRVIVEIPNTAHFNRRKIRQVWTDWCDVYRCCDVLWRHAHGSTENRAPKNIGLDAARWLSILCGEELSYPVHTRRGYCIAAFNRYGNVAHLIVAMMWEIGPATKSPSSEKIRSMLEAHFDRFISNAITLQDWFVNYRVPHSRDALINADRQIRLSDIKGLKTDFSMVAALSGQEELVLSAYTADKFSDLSGNNKASTLKGILGL